MLEKSQNANAASWHRLRRAVKHFSLSSLLSKDPIWDFSSTQLLSAALHHLPPAGRRTLVFSVLVDTVELFPLCSSETQKVKMKGLVITHQAVQGGEIYCLI